MVGRRVRDRKRTASRVGIAGELRGLGTQPLFEACDTRALMRALPCYPSVSRASRSLLFAVLQRETMAFSRDLVGSLKTWILEASNIQKDGMRRDFPHSCDGVEAPRLVV